MTWDTASSTSLLAGDADSDDLEPVLEVTDLHVRIAGAAPSAQPPVDGVSLSVAAGETLGIVGESGSGKSMTAKAIMDLLPPAAVVGEGGSVKVCGKDLRTLTNKQRQQFWGVEASMVFQDPMTSLTPVLRVGHQVMEPLRHHLGLSKKDAYARAVALLESVGIADSERRMREYPHQLSGGMRQRVMIAIAVSCSPRLLVCDEPTTALDVTVQKQCLNLLTSLQADQGMAMVLITHDLAVVATRADHIVVMYAGTIVEQGAAHDVLQNPAHPYTRALLASLPDPTADPHTPLVTVPGVPPRERVEGCRFAPRCPIAQDVCLQRSPRLRPLESTDAAAAPHAAACYFPVGTPLPGPAVGTPGDGGTHSEQYWSDR